MTMDAVLGLYLYLHCQIVALGSPSWPVREQATAILRQTLPLSHPYLNLALRHPDLEVRRRAELLLEGWRGRLAVWHLSELERRLLDELGHTAWPWVDSLPPDHPQRNLAQSYLPEGPCRTGAPDWTEYRLASREWAWQRLLAGDSPGAIWADLVLMVAGDARFCQGGNGYWAGRYPLPAAAVDWPEPR